MLSCGLNWATPSSKNNIPRIRDHIITEDSKK